MSHSFGRYTVNDTDMYNLHFESAKYLDTYNSDTYLDTCPLATCY